MFLIKSYESGILSKYLSKSDEPLLLISTPKGNLDLNKFKNYKNFAVLAAGSGITPMVSYDVLKARLTLQKEFFIFRFL